MTQFNSETMQQFLESSPFLKTLKAVRNKPGRSRLFGDQIRQLTPEEIHRLEVQGNRCNAWEKLFVAKGFATDRIENNRFFGSCMLGRFTGRSAQIEENVQLPTGIYDSMIVDSEIGDECCIIQADMIHTAVIGNSCGIISTGLITGSEKTSFGSGQVLTIGPETGGREVSVFAEMNMDSAKAAAMERSPVFQKAYAAFIDSYRREAESPFCLIQAGSVIRQANSLKDVYTGPYTVIEGVHKIENAALLSTTESPVKIEGVTIVDSILQQGCEIRSMAVIDNSLIMEHASVGRHGKVTASIIGPKSEIEGGEITSSLLGPLTGAHHQSLVISAIWPGGRGNVGYGANVGSNHTGRLPDQEIHCPEGIFFGLGVNIKFPADFSEAAYSIIATGVNTLPQRMQMPFALINTKSRDFSGVSPACNEIFPGWMILNNMYMLQRNMLKYRKRAEKLKNPLETEVFRSDVMASVVKARGRLRELSGKSYYTDREIPALGRNVMSERARENGIESYDFAVTWYALRIFTEWFDSYIQSGKPANARSKRNPLWTEVEKYISEAGLEENDTQVNLNKYKMMCDRVRELTFTSRKKDDDRGLAIISDYMKVHTPAEEDEVVMAVTKEMNDRKSAVDNLLKEHAKG